MDRDEAMLNRVAELDLALAEHIHAHALAATEPEIITGLARAYHHVARSLRQSIVEKSRLRRERTAPAPAARATAPHDEADVDPELRAAQVFYSVGRVVAAAHPTDDEHQDELLERLDDWLTDEHEGADWMEAPLDAQVRDYCARLDLPPRLAGRWAALPDAPRMMDAVGEEVAEAFRARQRASGWRGSG